MKLIRKFFRLSKNEKLLFIEALMCLFFSKLLVTILPFKKSIGLFVPSEELHTQADPLLLKEIKNAVSRANKLAFWKNICLVKSFTARFMLQRRGISSVMYLGLKLNEEEKKKLNAHAWLIAKDVEITPKLTGFKEIHSF